ncbi:unnamed protein product [Closterium sp. Naga37s-1]|nr:unnamed protein product [Closterium sp. Naga37s-1]
MHDDREYQLLEAGLKEGFNVQGGSGKGQGELPDVVHNKEPDNGMGSGKESEGQRLEVRETEEGVLEAPHKLDRETRSGRLGGGESDGEREALVCKVGQVHERSFEAHQKPDSIREIGRGREGDSGKGREEAIECEVRQIYEGLCLDLAAAGDEEACSADRSADVAGQRGRHADVARHGLAGADEALCIGDVADLDFNRGEGVKVDEGQSEVQGVLSAVELDSVRLLASLPSLNSSDLASALPALGSVNPLPNTEGVMESTRKSSALALVGPPHDTEAIAEGIEAASRLPAHTWGCSQDALLQHQPQCPQCDPAVAASDLAVAASDLAVAASDLAVAAIEPDIAAPDPDVAVPDPPALATELAVAAIEPDVAAPDPAVAAPLDPAVAALSDIQLPPGFTEGEAATEYFPPSSDPPVDTLDPLVETQNPFAVTFESTQKSTSFDPPVDTLDPLVETQNPFADTHSPLVEAPHKYDPPVDTLDPLVETQNPFADTLSPLVDAEENVLGGRGGEGGGGEGGVGGGGRGGEEEDSEEGAGKRGENEGGDVGTVGQGGHNDNWERKVAEGVGGGAAGQEGASALSYFQASLQPTSSVSGWLAAEVGTKTGANAAAAHSCSDARAAASAAAGGDGVGEQGPSAGDTAKGGRGGGGGGEGGQPSDSSSGVKPDQSEPGDDLSHGSQPGVKHGLSAVEGSAGAHAMLPPAGMVAPPYEHMRQPGMAVTLADVLDAREPSVQAGVTVDEQGLGSLGFPTSPLEGLGLEEGLGFKQELGFKQQLSLGLGLGFKSANLPRASTLPGVQHAMSVVPELQQAIASSPLTPAPPLAPHPPSLPPTPPPSPVPFLASLPTSHASPVPPPAATPATQITVPAQVLLSHTPSLAPSTAIQVTPARVTASPWSTITVMPSVSAHSAAEGHVEVHAGRAGCDNNEMLLKIGVEGSKEVVVRQGGDATREVFTVEVSAGQVKLGIKSGEDVTLVVGKGVGEGTTARVEEGG